VNILKSDDPQFSQGLIFLTWPRLIGALLIATVLLISSVLFLSPNLITGSFGKYVLRDELDDYGFASKSVYELRSQLTKVDGLALIGTAAMREGLLLAPQTSDLLKSHLQKDIKVIPLMTGGQSGLEMAALAVEAASKINGVIVLGVSPSRLAANPAELASLVRNPRLAFQSKAFEEEAKANGHIPTTRFGLYSLDNYQFFVARYWFLLRNLIVGPINDWNMHPYLNLEQKDEVAWLVDAKKLKDRLANYDAYADKNLQSYDRLLVRLKDFPNVKVVLLDIPLNPRTINEVMGINFYSAHRKRIAEFAKKHAVSYVNVNDINSLTENDFQDWSHIRSSRAQKEITEHLLKTVRLLLINL
jgi:hypothetical protein